ncbi:MAG: DUF669 domain-containing protein [Candidatus Eisenbacteria bacterium]|uniref:DUF669 domain-containing protein n=1 Tax=Eiseniibacteriota bacterium TaxID=2212470 RepID=A0A948S1A2_UNCEI|nr:DUF669 domain-containing protein [Candidatus Eisenbacteria bacterium]MBU1950038.1 DUF669 domain-containing protein [Candidatus Eisenbacteria bacterium]MBU2691999.1 DUF669 domain-containing protein [Candidatus Eisenbacteria bacterium]
MPRINFSNVDDAQNFKPLPEGVYHCRVIDVKESSTLHGDDMWKLWFEVASGDYQGRRIFDNLVFSDRAMPRVKHICSKLGVDVTGEVNMTPALLIDREAMVSVIEADYVDEGGNTKTSNRVLFAGYEAVEPPSNDEDGEVSFP